MSTIVDCGNDVRCQEPDSDAVMLYTQDIKVQLLELLHAINQHDVGSFATYGVLSHPANPGLYVHGLGIIGLPLSERLAVELAGISHQAPFGKGSKTIVDTTVRKTWELDPSQFELRNPAWQSCVKDAIQSVGKELGIVGGMSSISAQLYKMLLYEKGAFFDRHRDSEKAPGMFGTLVIALPSSHTGGEAEVYFNGQRQTLKTAAASAFGYTYLAWYADVEHAVRQITSGYRLVLTYNLIHKAPGVPQSAASLGNETLKLGNLLSIWKSNLESSKTRCPKMLAYMLEHKYTDANLRYDHLKGKDRLKTQYMNEACEEQGYCMFLANIERTVYGGCDEEGYPLSYYSGSEPENDESKNDHDDNSDNEGLHEYHKIDEVIDESLRLKVMLDMNGSKIAEDITIQEHNIVQEKPFAWKPDNEDYSGYTGNEGVSATHFYRNSCLVISPKDYQINLFFDSAKKGTKDINTWVGNLIEEHRVMPQDQKRKTDLIHLCELVIDTNQARNREREEGGRGFFNWRTEKGFSNNTLGLVVKAALQLRNPVLFEKAASVTNKRWPPPVYFDVGQTLQQLGLSNWHKGLESSLTSVTKIHEVYEALAMVWRGYRDSEDGKPKSSDSTVLGDWIRERVTASLSVNAAVSKEDGKVLVRIASKYGEGYMFKYILPLVKRHISTDTSFSVAFLECLLASGEQTKIRKEAVQNDSEHIRTTAKPDDRSSSAFMAGDDIATLIGHCISLHLDEEVDQILDRIIGEAATVDTSAFQILLLPFLRGLLAVMQSHNITYTELRYQVFFQSLLELYVQRYIGAEPPAPRDWTKPRNGCGCTDCQELDRFLVDPDRMIGRFSLAEKRRRHLERQIYGTYEHATERTSIPHTLVVTKNNNTWKTSLKAWEQRCDEATRNLQDIGLPALEGLLADRYIELTEFTAMRLGTPVPTRTPLVTTTQARGPAEAVAKASANNLVLQHPSHIIDLTG